MLRHSFHALGLLLFSTGAFAQVTLIYNGQPMGVPGGTPDQVANGTIVLAEPLAPNGTQIVTPISAGFQGFGTGLTIPTGYPDPTFAGRGSFSFTTVNGVITAWNVMTTGTGGSTVATLNLTDAGDSYELDAVSNSCQTHPMPGICYDNIFSNTAAGSWSVPQAQDGAGMATLQALVTSLQAQVNTLTVERNSYLNGYAAANVIIKAQNAALVQLKIAVFNLNAQVAKCRANMGKC